MISLPAMLAVRPDHAGKRVEHVLLKELPGLRESFALMLLHRGKVLLDGRPLERGERLPGAGRIEVFAPDPRSGPSGPVPNTRLALEVRHEDSDIIVVEKPAGLAMHPGPGHGSNTLQNALVARFPELIALTAARGFGLVQRLDRDVSGLVVVARTVAGYEALVAAFTAREVDKRYRALVLGAPPTPEGSVATPVEEREARSDWKTLDRAESAKSSGQIGSDVVSMLELHSHTGRKHQLRVHMAALGCPILGDKQHGVGVMPLTRALGLKRIALHASSLELKHPGTGKRARFESSWPEELSVTWERMKSGERVKRVKRR